MATRVMSPNKQKFQPKIDDLEKRLLKNGVIEKLTNSILGEQTEVEIQKMIKDIVDEEVRKYNVSLRIDKLNGVDKKDK
jgi:hypothetical protein